MDVYLVPVATATSSESARYELYCETPDEPDDETPPTSMWGRLVGTFKRALAEGEAERRHRARGGEPRKDGGFRRTITRKLAEAVAEQRLLWHMRKMTAAQLFHPDDLPSAEAQGIMRASLTRDYRKHRRWLVIDSAITVATGLVAIVPGPNILAYYFVFRAVGHFLAMRGASRGLTGLEWTDRPSRPLTQLRLALDLPEVMRASEVETIATALGLEDLAHFIKRVALRRTSL